MRIFKALLNKRALTRSACLWLCVIYVFTNVAFAHKPEANFWQERRDAVSRQSEKNQSPNEQAQDLKLAALPAPLLPQIGSVNPIASSLHFPAGISVSLHSQRTLPLNNIPWAYATIKDTSIKPGSGNNLVLLIQDVHGNPEAQTNIARIIEAAKPASVAIEGAQGLLDFTALRALPEPRIVEASAHALLSNGEIGGPVYAGLTGKNLPTQFHGLENPELYRANVQAYRDSLPLKDKVTSRIQSLAAGLTKEKEATYSPELKKLDGARTKYLAGQLSLGEYLESIVPSPSAGEGQGEGKNIQRFLEAYHLEKSLNFQQVEQERSRILEALVAKLNKTQLSELLGESLAYRTGKIGYAAYYGYLRSLCEKNGVGLNTYPAMAGYVHYVLLTDQINLDKLQEEINTAENARFLALAVTPEQQELVQRSKHLSLIRQLVKFEMTPAGWKEYSTLTNPHPNPLPELGEGSRQMRTDLVPFEAFYLNADARNKAMMTNLPRAKGLSVIVVGGYHTPGLTHLLKEHGISYIVLAPKITKVEGDPSAYLSVFAREKTPLEKLFEGEKLFMAPAVWVPGSAIPDTNQAPRAKATFLRLFSSLLKHYRLTGGFTGLARVAAIALKSGLFKLAPSSYTPGNPLLATIDGKQIDLNSLTQLNDTDTPPLTFKDLATPRGLRESFEHYLPWFPLLHANYSEEQWIGMGLIYGLSMGGGLLSYNLDLGWAAVGLAAWLGGWFGHAVIYNELAVEFGWAPLTRGSSDENRIPAGTPSEKASFKAIEAGTGLQIPSLLRTAPANEWIELPPESVRSFADGKFSHQHFSRFIKGEKNPDFYRLLNSALMEIVRNANDAVGDAFPNLKTEEELLTGVRVFLRETEDGKLTFVVQNTGVIDLDKFKDRLPVARERVAGIQSMLEQAQRDEEDEVEFRGETLFIDETMRETKETLHAIDRTMAKRKLSLEDFDALVKSPWFTTKSTVENDRGDITHGPGDSIGGLGRGHESAVEWAEETGFQGYWLSENGHTAFVLTQGEIKSAARTSHSSRRQPPKKGIIDPILLTLFGAGAIAGAYILGVDMGALFKWLATAGTLSGMLGMAYFQKGDLGHGDFPEAEDLPHAFQVGNKPAWKAQWDGLLWFLKLDPKTPYLLAEIAGVDVVDWTTLRIMDLGQTIQRMIGYPGETDPSQEIRLMKDAREQAVIQRENMGWEGAVAYMIFSGDWDHGYGHNVFARDSDGREQPILFDLNYQRDYELEEVARSIERVLAWNSHFDKSIFLEAFQRLEEMSAEEWNGVLENADPSWKKNLEQRRRNYRNLAIDVFTSLLEKPRITHKTAIKSILTKLENGRKPAATEESGPSAWPQDGSIHTVYLSDDEVERYLGTETLRKAKKEGRMFYIRALNPRNDGHFIDEWKQEVEKDDAWREEWGGRYAIAKIPFFKSLHSAETTFGLVSRTASQERLEGYISGSRSTVVSPEGPITYALKVSELELYYKNIGVNRQRAIGGVANLLWDLTLKWARESGLINNGLSLDAATPGSQRFSDRNKLSHVLVNGKSRRGLSQDQIAAEYEWRGLKNVLNHTLPPSQAPPLAAGMAFHQPESVGFPTAGDLTVGRIFSNGKQVWEAKDGEGNFWYLTRDEDAPYVLAREAGLNVVDWTTLDLNDFNPPDQEILLHMPQSSPAPIRLMRDYLTQTSAPAENLGWEGVIAYVLFTGDFDHGVGLNVHSHDVAGHPQPLLYDLSYYDRYPNHQVLEFLQKIFTSKFSFNESAFLKAVGRFANLNKDQDKWQKVLDSASPSLRKSLEQRRAGFQTRVRDMLSTLINEAKIKPVEHRAAIESIINKLENGKKPSSPLPASVLLSPKNLAAVTASEEAGVGRTIWLKDLNKLNFSDQTISQMAAQLGVIELHSFDYFASDLPDLVEKWEKYLTAPKNEENLLLFYDTSGALKGFLAMTIEGSASELKQMATRSPEPHATGSGRLLFNTYFDRLSALGIRTVKWNARVGSEGFYDKMLRERGLKKNTTRSGVEYKVSLSAKTRAGTAIWPSTYTLARWLKPNLRGTAFYRFAERKVAPVWEPLVSSIVGGIAFLAFRNLGFDYSQALVMGWFMGNLFFAVKHWDEDTMPVWNLLVRIPYFFAVGAVFHSPLLYALGSPSHPVMVVISILWMGLSHFLNNASGLPVATWGKGNTTRELQRIGEIAGKTKRGRLSEDDVIFAIDRLTHEDRDVRSAALDAFRKIVGNKSYRAHVLPIFAIAYAGAFLDNPILKELKEALESFVAALQPGKEMTGFIEGLNWPDGTCRLGTVLILKQVAIDRPELLDPKTVRPLVGNMSDPAGTVIRAQAYITTTLVTLALLSRGIPTDYFDFGGFPDGNVGEKQLRLRHVASLMNQADVDGAVKYLNSATLEARRHANGIVRGVAYQNPELITPAHIETLLAGDQRTNGETMDAILDSYLSVGQLFDIVNHLIRLQHESAGGRTKQSAGRAAVRFAGVLSEPLSEELDLFINQESNQRELQRDLRNLSRDRDITSNPALPIYQDRIDKAPRNINRMLTANGFGLEFIPNNAGLWQFTLIPPPAPSGIVFFTTLYVLMMGAAYWLGADPATLSVLGISVILGMTLYGDSPRRKMNAHDLQEAATYIIYLFASEPERTEFPSLRQIAKQPGPSYQTISNYLGEIRTKLGQQIRGKEFDPILRSRILTALNNDDELWSIETLEDLPIERLFARVRIMGSRIQSEFKRHEIHTTGELMKALNDPRIYFKNFGAATWNLVNTALQRYGFRLPASRNPSSESETNPSAAILKLAPDYLEVLWDQSDAVLTKEPEFIMEQWRSLAKLVKGTDLETFAWHSARYENIESLPKQGFESSRGTLIHFHLFNLAKPEYLPFDSQILSNLTYRLNVDGSDLNAGIYGDLDDSEDHGIVVFPLSALNLPQQKFLKAPYFPESVAHASLNVLPEGKLPPQVLLPVDMRVKKSSIQDFFERYQQQHHLDNLDPHLQGTLQALYLKSIWLDRLTQAVKDRAATRAEELARLQKIEGLTGNPTQDSPDFIPAGQGEFVIGRNQMLKTTGASPCVICTIRDPLTGIGLIAHIDADNANAKETYRRLRSALLEAGVSPTDLPKLKISLHGNNGPGNGNTADYVRRGFEEIWNREINHWDFQWAPRSIAFNTQTGEWFNLVNINPAWDRSANWDEFHVQDRHELFNPDNIGRPIVQYNPPAHSTPQSLVGTYGGPAVYGGVMPLLEEYLRMASIGSFGIWGAAGYAVLHAFVHFWIDIYAARGDHLTWKQFLTRRFPARLLYSIGFSLPYLPYFGLSLDQSFLAAFFAHTFNNLFLPGLTMSVVGPINPGDNTSPDTGYYQFSPDQITRLFYLEPSELSNLVGYALPPDFIKIEGPEQERDIAEVIYELEKNAGTAAEKNPLPLEKKVGVSLRIYRNAAGERRFRAKIRNLGIIDPQTIAAAVPKLLRILNAIRIAATDGKYDTIIKDKPTTYKLSVKPGRFMLGQGILRNSAQEEELLKLETTIGALERTDLSHLTYEQAAALIMKPYFTTNPKAMANAFLVYQDGTRIDPEGTKTMGVGLAWVADRLKRYGFSLRVDKENDRVTVFEFEGPAPENVFKLTSPANPTKLSLPIWRWMFGNVATTTGFVTLAAPLLEIWGLPGFSLAAYSMSFTAWTAPSLGGLAFAVLHLILDLTELAYSHYAQGPPEKAPTLSGILQSFAIRSIASVGISYVSFIPFFLLPQTAALIPALILAYLLHSEWNFRVPEGWELNLAGSPRKQPADPVQKEIASLQRKAQQGAQARRPDILENAILSLFSVYTREYEEILIKNKGSVEAAEEILAKEQYAARQTLKSIVNDPGHRLFSILNPSEYRHIYAVFLDRNLDSHRLPTPYPDIVILALSGSRVAVVNVEVKNSPASVKAAQVDAVYPKKKWDLSFLYKVMLNPEHPERTEMSEGQLARLERYRWTLFRYVRPGHADLATRGITITIRNSQKVNHENRLLTIRPDALKALYALSFRKALVNYAWLTGAGNGTKAAMQWVSRNDEKTLYADYIARLYELALAVENLNERPAKKLEAVRVVAYIQELFDLLFHRLRGALNNVPKDQRHEIILTALVRLRLKKMPLTEETLRNELEEVRDNVPLPKPAPAASKKKLPAPAVAAPSPAAVKPARPPQGSVTDPDVAQALNGRRDPSRRAQNLASKMPNRQDALDLIANIVQTDARLPDGNGRILPEAMLLGDLLIRHGYDPKPILEMVLQFNSAHQTFAFTDAAKAALRAGPASEAAYNADMSQELARLQGAAAPIATPQPLPTPPAPKSAPRGLSPDEDHADEILRLRNSMPKNPTLRSVLGEDAAKIKRIIYPGVGLDSAFLHALFLELPNVTEIFLIDPDFKTPDKIEWTPLDEHYQNLLAQLAREHNVQMHIISNQYENTAIPKDQPGETMVINKFSFHRESPDAAERRARLRAAILRDTNTGDWVLAMPEHWDPSALNWGPESQKGDKVRLAPYGRWADFILWRLTDKDRPGTETPHQPASGGPNIMSFLPWLIPTLIAGASLLLVAAGEAQPWVWGVTLAIGFAAVGMIVSRNLKPTGLLTYGTNEIRNYNDYLAAKRFGLMKPKGKVSLALSIDGEFSSTALRWNGPFGNSTHVAFVFDPTYVRLYKFTFELAGNWLGDSVLKTLYIKGLEFLGLHHNTPLTDKRAGYDEVRTEAVFPEAIQGLIVSPAMAAQVQKWEDQSIRDGYTDVHWTIYVAEPGAKELHPYQAAHSTSNSRVEVRRVLPLILLVMGTLLGANWKDFVPEWWLAPAILIGAGIAYLIYRARHKPATAQQPVRPERMRASGRTPAEYAAQWAHNIQPDVADLRNRFFRMLPVEGTVLDAGTGPGRDAAWFHAQGRESFGVDADPGMIEQARLHHPEVPTENYSVMNLTQLHFENGTFAGIWDNAAFHFLTPEGADAALGEYHRTLKPQGKLFIRAKRGDGPEELVDPKSGERQFYNFYQESRLQNLAENHGFKILGSGTYQEPTAPGFKARNVEWVYLLAEKTGSAPEPTNQHLTTEQAGAYDQLMQTAQAVPLGEATYGATSNGLVSHELPAQINEIQTSGLPAQEQTPLINSALLGAARAIENGDAVTAERQIDQLFKKASKLEQPAYAHFVIESYLSDSLKREIEHAVSLLKQAQTHAGVIVTVKNPALINEVQQLGKDLPKEALFIVQGTDQAEYIDGRLSLTAAVATALKSKGLEDTLGSATVHHFLNNLTDVTLDLPAWLKGELKLDAAALTASNTLFLLLNTIAIPIQASDLGPISTNKLKAAELAAENA